MAHVTDYDVWHVNENPVTVEMVVRTLINNTVLAQKAVRRLTHLLDKERTCSCGSALSEAIITNPSIIPPDTLQKLDLLVGKYYQ